MTVMGVDISRGNWVGVTSNGSGHFAASIDALVRAGGDLDVIAIDIPIGLPTANTRACDLEARRFLGPRRSSVFATPTRSALLASTHSEAVAINRSITGKGVSIQAFGLRKKILEIDSWLATAPCPIIEVHPEVSFRTMAGHDLAAKWTWLGASQRHQLLAEVGVTFTALGAAGGMAGVDDVLDAAAAAWSAGRYLRREAVPHPASRTRGDDSSAIIWA